VLIAHVGLGSGKPQMHGVNMCMHCTCCVVYHLELQNGTLYLQNHVQKLGENAEGMRTVKLIAFWLDGHLRPLLCRLLGLAPEAQGQIFDLYQAVLEASIQRARREGKYDEGIVDVKGTAVTLAQPPQVSPTFFNPS